MRVFVTGGSGFMGQHLIAALQKRGNIVVAPSSASCDLRDPRSLESLSHYGSFDRIYHLAAWTQAGDFCLHHAGEQWIFNQQINTNILAWWKNRQPQAKFVSIGTSCAYDPLLQHVESNYLEGRPTESLFTYAMTKRMLYSGLAALHSQFGLEYLCVVPSTLYGPGYHTDGRQMHFIFDLIRKILKGRHFGEQVVLWGDGYQRRELVLMDDFIRLLLNIDQSHKNDLVNIGAGQDFTIREFAKVISDVVHYDVSLIRYDESRYVGARSKLLNVDHLKDIVGNPDLTPLSDGIRRTVNWFESASVY